VEHVVRMGEMRTARNVDRGTWREDHFQDLGIDGKIILKLGWGTGCVWTHKKKFLEFLHNREFLRNCSVPWNWFG
jgi:hypothetical protein